MQSQAAAKDSPGEGDPAILLGVLSAVESDASVTQRKIALELGIALGLTNLYLKRCVRKGWIKIRQVPMRRLGYYLTPGGFKEKTRLTAEYLAWNLEFFRRARLEATALLAAAKAEGLKRFVFVGCGDFAEVAVLSALDADIDVVGIVDALAPVPRCAGVPVYQSIDALGAHLSHVGGSIDAIMVTETRAPVDALETTRRLAEALRIPCARKWILIPGVLKMSGAAGLFAETKRS